MSRARTILFTCLAAALPSGLTRAAVGAAGNADCCCAALPPTAPGDAGAAPHPAPLRSLYLDPSAWQTDSGSHLRLPELKGRPAIVALFYTSCHVACPATLRELVDVERHLPADSRVAIVLVTIDPDTDTPAALAECRAENRLADRFILLRGTAAQTRSFADAAGILYRVESARILHMPRVVVVDSNGNVDASFPGTHANPSEVAQAALRAERPVRAAGA